MVAVIFQVLSQAKFDRSYVVQPETSMIYLTYALMSELAKFLRNVANVSRRISIAHGVFSYSVSEGLEFLSGLVRVPAQAIFSRLCSTFY